MKILKYSQNEARNLSLLNFSNYTIILELKYFKYVNVLNN